MRWQTIVYKILQGADFYHVDISHTGAIESMHAQKLLALPRASHSGEIPLVDSRCMYACVAALVLYAHAVSKLWYDSFDCQSHTRQRLANYIIF